MNLEDLQAERRREMRKLARQRKRETLLATLELVGEAQNAGNMHAQYQFIRKVCPKAFRRRVCLKNEKGGIMSNDEECEALAAYARKLFSDTEFVPPELLSLPKEWFTQEAWKLALNKLQTHKAVPKFSASVYNWKQHAAQLVPTMQQIACSTICSEKPYVPDLWMRVQLAWLPKPGYVEDHTAKILQTADKEPLTESSTAPLMHGGKLPKVHGRAGIEGHAGWHQLRSAQECTARQWSSQQGINSSALRALQSTAAGLLPLQHILLRLDKQMELLQQQSIGQSLTQVCINIYTANMRTWSRKRLGTWSSLIKHITQGDHRGRTTRSSKATGRSWKRLQSRTCRNTASRMKAHWQSSHAEVWGQVQHHARTQAKNSKEHARQCPTLFQDNDDKPIAPRKTEAAIRTSSSICPGFSQAKANIGTINQFFHPKLRLRNPHSLCYLNVMLIRMNGLRKLTPAWVSYGTRAGPRTRAFGYALKEWSSMDGAVRLPVFQDPYHWAL